MPRTRPAAAGVLLLALVGCTASHEPAGPEEAPRPAGTTTAAPARAPVPSDGSIYFAADARAGRTLSDPVEHAEVEIRPGPMDIYLARRGEPVRRVVATRAHERCPAVSPDGSRLAYLEDATVVIAALNENGDPTAAEVRVRLDRHDLHSTFLYHPRNSYGTACPQWSPDGRRLGYQITLGDPGTPLYDDLTAEIHAVTGAGADRVLASFPTEVWHAEPDFAWSPDGDSVAYAAVDGVWRVSPGGGTPRAVWRAPAGDPTQMLAIDFDRSTSLAWSRRGELAFTVRGFEPTDPDKPMGSGREIRTVVVVDPASGRTLLDVPTVEFDGAGSETWSPDGSTLALARGSGRILLFSPASGTTVRVRPRLEGERRVEYSDPSWAPDGRQLLVRARHRRRGFALVSVPLDGSPGEVRTPWTWALDWTRTDDVSWVGPQRSR